MENETVEPTETRTTTVAPTITDSETVAPTPAVVATTADTRITAGPLTESIDRDGCSVTRLCAAEPSTCDPSTSSSCFFYSAKQKTGGEFAFELSGQSTGYIGLTLSTDDTLGGNDITYICAADGSTVVLITATLNNGVLKETQSGMSDGKGRIDGDTIQCSFCATLEQQSSRRKRRSTSGYNYSTGFQTGTYDTSSGELGTPTTKIKTNIVDLSNSNSIITSTTVAPTTMFTTEATTIADNVTVAPTVAGNVTVAATTPAVVAATALTSVTAAPLTVGDGK
ncbi:putative ferric-chelate reductase 1 [Gouania willdenowi]|uniref:putative ferric-chelate reductase 1 n=1 Tax=Gouania willdenowi TaxID=441366 RepID=UPI0010558E5B|nr:putative ferric-chelate reductase 1 [Gouania willdenowi]